MARPKQFLSFSGERTLLQETLDRIEAQAPRERIWVITGSAHRDQAMAQLPELEPGRIVGEPQGRDTAACIALGAALIAKSDPEAVMIVMPADHVIEPAQEFRRAVHAAEQLAEDNPRALITFGIPPTYPATGYGYIQRGESVGQRQGIPAFRVKQFKEKPSFAAAEQYIASGAYYWNSGIFVWKVGAILDELKLRKPQLISCIQRIADAWGTPRQDQVFRAEYANAEKISIDFAVMEHAREVLVVQAPYHWDDVGSWLALERRSPQDAHGNTVQALHVGVATSKCVIVSDAGHLIATAGVSDLIIIQDGNATLVASRAAEGNVKDIVEILKKRPDLEKFL
jgi:mannose-1-phosphate guanylyltransferase